MSRADVTLGDRQPTLRVRRRADVRARAHDADGAVADADDDAVADIPAPTPMPSHSHRSVGPMWRQRRRFFDGEIVPVATPAGELAVTRGCARRRPRHSPG